MEFSEHWRSVFPVSSVFAPPSLAPSHDHGPLLFSPLPPPTPLLSFPFPPLTPTPFESSSHRLLLAHLSRTSFLPFPDVASLSELIHAAPSPPFPPHSNLLAVLRSRASPSLILFFPYGDNADKVAFAQLADYSLPVALSVQSDGFRHPKHRILRLAASPANPSWPSSQHQCQVEEGFLLAATLYSVSWFAVQSQRSASPPVLVPVSKHGFNTAVVHACWNKHLPAECAVLLESGELCLFDLDTRHGSRTRFDFDCSDGLGSWLSCEYGSQTWMMIIATTKAIILIDLRSRGRAQHKVLAKVNMPGYFQTEPLVRTGRYVAFCKAHFDDFHLSVVTDRQLILLDVRQPFTPVLSWQHGLESPNHVTMFRLSDLRSSKEYESASNSGFAILVGSLSNGEFSLFCYGPKEQDCPQKSHLYAWDLPSRFSLAGQHCSHSDGIIKEVFSTSVSGYGSYDSQHGKNSIVGYYVLPNDLSMLESPFDGFSLIRVTALGKLEMQGYRASRDTHDDNPCLESQHTSMVSCPSILCDTQGENISNRYRILNFHFLSEHLDGNLCSALTKHDTSVKRNKREMITSEDVAALANDDSRSSSQSVSDSLSNASVPMNMFEIASQNILSSLPSDILNVTFSTYKDMQAFSAKEDLEVPTCLPHNKLRPFLFTPSSISEKLTSKVVSGNALVGPVLPVHVLLAMQEMDKGIDTPSQGETDLVSHRCSEVRDALIPEISIAETGNCNGLSALQKLSDDKSYFVYEPEVKKSFKLDDTCTKKRKEEHKLEDQTCLHMSARPYKDENFMTFICGKAGIPYSGPEQAMADMFDCSPVRMIFDFPGIETQPAEEKVYICLKKQFLTWQNNFNPYRDFCSSYKISNLPK